MNLPTPLRSLAPGALGALGLLATLPAACKTVDVTKTESTAAAPRFVVTVRFESELDVDEIHRRYPERMPEFRALPGLIQKYYLHDPATDEWCGIYLWDSKASAQAYLQSDLRKTIPQAYGVVGTPRVESFDVIDILR